MGLHISPLLCKEITYRLHQYLFLKLRNCTFLIYVHFILCLWRQRPLFDIRAHIYIYHVGLFVHDFIHAKLPRSFDGYFPKQIDSYSRRANQIPRYNSRPRTAFSEKLPNHNFPLIWNALHPSIISTLERTSFKSAFKSNILDSYSSSIQNCQNPFCTDCQST